MEMTPPVTVDITIERVTVEGFGQRDSLGLRRALERSLTRLVEERGLPGGWATDAVRGDVRAAPLRVATDAGERDLADALARRIYEAFGP
jgi:hypothetical protein